MLIKANIYNQRAEAVGEIELSDQVFGLVANQALVHQAMVTQLANQRQVLAHTKGRGEVRGGGKKPWRQKGTGRARAGSIRSPIWIGGGVTFGPTKDRNFKKEINKKMRQKAMLMVLSDRVANGHLIILDKLVMGEYKTKAFAEMLKMLENIKHKTENRQEDKVNSKKDDISKADQKILKKRKVNRSVLIINDKKDDKVKYSARNLAGLEIINLDNINILDLLKYRNVILTKAGVKALEQRYKI